MDEIHCVPDIGSRTNDVCPKIAQVIYKGHGDRRLVFHDQDRLLAKRLGNARFGAHWRPLSPLPSGAQSGHGAEWPEDVNARRDTVIEVIDVKPCHPKPAEPTKLIREFGSGKHIG